MPHLTLSFGRGDGGHKTSGDLSGLSLGLGCLLAWALAAGLGLPAALDAVQPPFAAIEPATGAFMRGVFLAAFLAAMLFIGCTNQRFLRFYVDQRALVLALTLCVAGTACAAFGGSDGPLGWVLACGGSLLMGVGAGILFPLWGTAFARYEFPTITLNAIGGAALGTICAVALIDWVPAPMAVPLAMVLAAVSVLVLWQATPVPYYRRREIPVFHALRVSRVRFLVHLGVPLVLFGVSFGILGNVCLSGAFSTGNMACGLLVGAACALCLIAFIASIALMRDEAHWDTLFRYLLPVVGLGLLGVPLFCGMYQMGAVFLMTVGWVVLLALVWIMLSDMSQEFRLSPLFVFGIGGTLFVAGAAFGALLVPAVSEWEIMSPVRWTGLAIGAIVCLMLAGSLNPRKRDVVKMLAEKRPVMDVTSVNQMVVDDAAAHGTQATEEQREAALGAGALGPLDGADVGNAALSGTAVGGASVGGIAVGQVVGGAVTGVAGVGSSASNAPVETAGDPARARAAAAFAENARIVMGMPASASGVPGEAMGPGAGTGLRPVSGAGSGVEAAVAPTENPTAQGADQASEGQQRAKGSFYRRCEEIADQYLLSRRETEVLFLLAKGHKAGFIEDKLCISRSTAKTHINHIYKKMDIHTQQELLNMVEDRLRPGQASEDIASAVPATHPMHHGF